MAKTDFSYAPATLRMHSFMFAVFVLLSTVEKYDFLDEFHGIRENYCSKLESYNEDHIVPETKKIIKTVKQPCWSIKLYCTKLQIHTVTINKTVTVPKTRRVFDCCPGYEKINYSCVPTCRYLCRHGECVAPDVCLCDPGWRGPFCIDECEPNKYGRGCKENCTCINGDKCNKETGICQCFNGYTGNSCELPCPSNKYGWNCTNDCECKNGAICDAEDGTCYCEPGYEGVNCEKPCENGTHGDNCEEECICIPENTETCHHVDGMCICKPGFRGENCEEECFPDTYGQNCSKVCNCEENSYFCDPVTGECYCTPGWFGETCSEECPTGKFGDNCEIDCEVCWNVSALCDYITGTCPCPDGYYGEFCEKACPPGTWGSNCTNVCECNSSSLICNPENGKCFSSAGLKYDYDDRYLIRTFIGLGIGALIVVCVGLWYFFSKKKVPLSNSNNYGSFSRIIKLKFNKASSKTDFTSENAISNPVYDSGAVVLETERNDGGSIRGSLTSGMKYFRNISYINDEESKQSDIEKGDGAKKLQIKKTESKESGARKSHVLTDLSAALKELKHISGMKVGSTHSSIAELEKDFQPEVLDYFNIAENIYDKPVMDDHGNDCEKPDVDHANDNIYENPEIIKGDNRH